MNNARSTSCYGVHIHSMQYSQNLAYGDYDIYTASPDATIIKKRRISAEIEISSGQQLCSQIRTNFMLMLATVESVYCATHASGPDALIKKTT